MFLTLQRLIPHSWHFVTLPSCLFSSHFFKCMFGFLILTSLHLSSGSRDNYLQFTKVLRVRFRHHGLQSKRFTSAHLFWEFVSYW